MSPLIEIDQDTPHAKTDTGNMTEEDLYDHLRYFVDLHAQTRDTTKDPGSEVLYDMEPAALDRLHARPWIAPSVSVEARREAAIALSAIVATHLPVPHESCKIHPVETGVVDGEELRELHGVVGVCDDAVEGAVEVGFEPEFLEEGA